MRIAAMAALPPSGEYVQPKRPTKLNMIDLFSGPGGNSYAFRDFTNTRLYCENAAPARLALRANMKSGLIDAAPVHSDVRTLLDSKAYAEAKAHRPLLVSGSWPCQGNSTAGKMQGMWDDRSALLIDLCAVILDSEADIFFMENVPGAATNESYDYIYIKLAAKYVIRDDIIGAAQLGFPHVRKRFFCVGVRKGFDLFGLRFGGAERLAPGARQEPPRGRANEPARYKSSWKHLGNAVVPAASFYAFVTLLGVARAGSMHVFKPYAGPPLWLDPDAYTPPRRVTPRDLTSPPINKPFRMDLWPTPRAGCYGASHTLSYRSTRDLASAVRFEKATPNKQRAFVNLDWLKWLMGYPAAWNC